MSNNVVNEKKYIILEKLLEVKYNIRNVLQCYAESITDLKANHTEIKINNILHLSSNISYAAQAPKEYNIGMQLINYHPPSPQAEEMRAGMLEEYNIKTKGVKRNYFHKNLTNSSNTYNSELISRLKSQLVSSKYNNTIEIKQDVLLNSLVLNIDNENISSINRQETDLTIGKKRMRTTNIAFSYSDSEDSDE